jgi:1-deoxy-D-xylulose-5-phosphate reductoisomerase
MKRAGFGCERTPQGVTPRRVAILGSTGSIGRQALEVIASLPDLSACGLAAGNNWRRLAEQAEQFAPDAVAVASEAAGERLRGVVPEGIEVLCGPEAMTRLVRRAQPDVLLSGVVGTAGLAPTLAAIDCGARLAIANKETLVMAGALVVPAARAAGIEILPVDSEHSAIFQCLAAGRRSEVRRVVITASGGALRDWDDRAVQDATVDDALKHPTWQMGRKITIDSATLLNKALEVVEAHWLFDLPPEQIEVVLHAESIVHSFVEFHDGSVLAQLGQPDMATPIAYARCHPARARRDGPPLDLAATGTLTFAPLTERFTRAVNLGYDAIRLGGTAGAVLNAANEAVVQAFLAGRIRFGRIVPLVEAILNRAPASTEVSLEALLAADAWARQEVAQGLAALQAESEPAGGKRGP